MSEVIYLRGAASLEQICGVVAVIYLMYLRRVVASR
jgi:hypothetical protein